MLLIRPHPFVPNKAFTIVEQQTLESSEIKYLQSLTYDGHLIHHACKSFFLLRQLMINRFALNLIVCNKKPVIVTLQIKDELKICEYKKQTSNHVAVHLSK